MNLNTVQLSNLYESDMLSIQKLLNFLGDEANGYRRCYKKYRKEAGMQDIILHIQEVYQWRVRLMNSMILVWVLSPSQLRGSQCGAYSQQRCKHQYCCAWDCILQILFSSYRISLSLNQSFVTKIRSISISSPCHFHFVL